MPWSFACPDWQDRIRSGRSLIPVLPIDAKRAAKAVAVFDRLRLPDVPDKPAMKDAAGDWFREIVGALHGSVIAGERMIRELFLLVPKKNSKTSGGAGLMMDELLLNERPNAEFLLVAPTQAVSEIAFKQVEGMVDADAGLVSRMHVQTHLKKVTNRKTGATLQVRSFDANVLTGVKPSGVLLDELHLMSGIAKASSIIGQLRGGLISQPEGFLVFITTQSDKPPAGAFRAELTKARMIRDGKIEGAMLPILYEFPPDMLRGGESAAWRDSANWPMVTPNRGRSIRIERLQEEWQTARDTSPDEVIRWASQHLNIEIGLALSSDRWSGADFWERQAEPALDLADLIARSEVCTVGIDGGGLDDLFGLAVIGREAKTRKWLMWSHAWCHQSTLDRRKSEAPRLLDFERDGDLTIVRDLPDDIDDIIETVMMVEDAGKLAFVGLDPVGIGAIVDALAAKGIEDERRIGVSQGWKLADAIKTMERKLADGTLVHAGQPLMGWCVGNAKVEPRGNAIMITKQAAGSAKIDPLMAAFNAAWLMARNPEGGVVPADFDIKIW